ncbi:MAG: class II fructose-bisphosphate aldolase [Patescibacteria group bacterium]|nr:class II fructose-bisphosphate aldolase [Patescibacteria group bacterium]
MDLNSVLQKARQGSFALGAFNISTLEHFKAVVGACEKGNPVIAEMSSGEAEFFGIENFASLALHYRRDLDYPLFLNLDHAQELSKIEKALQCGFDMVHFDGSHLPLEENILQTKEVVELARDYGALVEGELDQAGGHSTIKDKQGTPVFTAVDDATRFVSETGVDLLACFFGNLHGVYGEELSLDLDHLQNLSTKLNCFISMHGGSGVRTDDVQKAAQGAVVKVNVNTELRMAWSTALREALENSPEEIVPYKVLPPVVESIKGVVERKLALLHGS